MRWNIFGIPVVLDFSAPPTDEELEQEYTNGQVVAICHATTSMIRLIHSSMPTRI